MLRRIWPVAVTRKIHALNMRHASRLAASAGRNWPGYHRGPHLFGHDPQDMQHCHFGGLSAVHPVLDQVFHHTWIGQSRGIA